MVSTGLMFHPHVRHGGGEGRMAFVSTAQLTLCRNLDFTLEP